MMDTIDIRVRGYHLDMFSHVNNARYLEFIEEGRWAHFEKMGFTIQDFIEMGVSMVVVNINITYKYPAGFGDTLTVTTSIKEIRKRSGTIDQKIFLKGTDTLVVDAEITFVFVDIKTGKSIEVDDEFKKRFNISGLETKGSPM